MVLTICWGLTLPYDQQALLSKEAPQQKRAWPALHLVFPALPLLSSPLLSFLCDTARGETWLWPSTAKPFASQTGSTSTYLTLNHMNYASLCIIRRISGRHKHSCTKERCIFDFLCEVYRPTHVWCGEKALSWEKKKTRDMKFVLLHINAVTTLNTENLFCYDILKNCVSLFSIQPGYKLNQKY